MRPPTRIGTTTASTRPCTTARSERSSVRTLNSGTRTQATATIAASGRDWMRSRARRPESFTGEWSDDPALFECCATLGGVADPRVDLVVVLADRRRRRPQHARGTTQARHRCVHGRRAHLVVRRLHDDAAGLHVRIVEELPDVVDGARGHAFVLEELDVLRERALRDEPADDPVDFLAPLDPLRVGLEPG